MAEQVSSTTLDEEVMMMGKESGFSQVPAHGVFAGDLDVRAAKETGGLEKEDADSISEPVELESPEEPDSTQMEDLIRVEKTQEALRYQEQALNLMDLKQEEEEEEDYGYDYEHKEPAPSFSQLIPEQNPVISSSATEILQAAFRPEPESDILHDDDDKVKCAKNILDDDYDYDADDVVKPEKKEDVLLKTEPEEQHQDFGIGDRVKEDVFASRFDQEKKAESLILDEKQEPESRNQVEERFRADPESTPAASASPSAYEPSLPSSAAAPAAPPPPTFSTLMQFTSEFEDSSLLASTQPSIKATMDSFGNDPPSRSMPRYDPDVLNQSDDDLMFETKRNPFQDFSPVEKPITEFSPFGETTAAKMSDSPSPDLVQNAHADVEPQDDSPVQDYEGSFDSREAATESLRQQLASSDFFGSAPKDDEESGLPPSLPDILKSSPHKQEKADSGSSEGSPDFSPVHRSGNDSPNAPFTLSANNPFAFEAKVPLVKEMTEETEARAAERARIDEEDEEEEEEVKKTSEQMFGTFDLVKETEISPQGPELAIGYQDDFKTLSQDSAQIVDKFECLSFPSVKAQPHSDSESPSADSLSPVLDAMAKNPASFQIEPEKNAAAQEEEAEAADEISEQEVSSEEFEFVEKPPRGAVDEFLETLESSKFAKASENADTDNVDDDDDDEDTAKFTDQLEEASPTEQETKSQTYFLLTESSNETSAPRGKAGLELSQDFQVPSQAAAAVGTAAPVSPATPPAVKTETFIVKKADPKDLKLPNLNAGAVVELLYWRDLKNSGIVFGASLLLLLSLSTCSIISVLSYVALALLSVTISFRIYKGVLQAIQKSDEGHPFKLYLDQDVCVPEDVVHKYSDIALGRINTAIKELRRLFLVEDLVDSLKFAVLMWILTYVGALFNGLTLLIMGLVAMFTCPVVYEKHQEQIDHYVSLVRNQVKDVVGKVQAKIPGAKKKGE